MDLENEVKELKENYKELLKKVQNSNKNIDVMASNYTSFRDSLEQRFKGLDKDNIGYQEKSKNVVEAIAGEIEQSGEEGYAKFIKSLLESDIEAKQKNMKEEILRSISIPKSSGGGNFGILLGTINLFLLIAVIVWLFLKF